MRKKYAAVENCAIQTVVQDKKDLNKLANYCVSKLTQNAGVVGVEVMLSGFSGCVYDSDLASKVAIEHYSLINFVNNNIDLINQNNDLMRQTSEDQLISLLRIKGFQNVNFLEDIKLNYSTNMKNYYQTKMNEMNGKGLLSVEETPVFNKVVSDLTTLFINDPRYYVITNKRDELACHIAYTGAMGHATEALIEGNEACLAADFTLWVGVACHVAVTGVYMLQCANLSHLLNICLNGH